MYPCGMNCDCNLHKGGGAFFPYRTPAFSLLCYVKLPCSKTSGWPDFSETKDCSRGDSAIKGGDILLRFFFCCILLRDCFQDLPPRETASRKPMRAELIGKALVGHCQGLGAIALVSLPRATTLFHGEQLCRVLVHNLPERRR